MGHETHLRSEVFPILHFSYVLSLTAYMTTSTKYPIGSNALWEVHSIFTCASLPYMDISIKEVANDVIDFV